MSRDPILFEAIRYVLSDIYDQKQPLGIRKAEMMQVAATCCQGYPSWSAIYGFQARPLDDLSYGDLQSLLSRLPNY